MPEEEEEEEADLHPEVEEDLIEAEEHQEVGDLSIVAEEVHEVAREVAALAAALVAEEHREAVALVDVVADDEPISIPVV